MSIMNSRSIAVLFVIAALSGCASIEPDYSVSKANDQEAQFLEGQTQHNVYGHWLSDSDLKITLGFPLDYGAKMPVSSLRAEVSGDLITLHLVMESDKSVDMSGPFPTCDDLMKLVYVLHKLPRKAYRVQVAPVLYGHLGAWDVLPLEIK